MNLTRTANLLALALVITLAAVGCKKNPYGVTKLPPNGSGTTGGPGPGEMANGTAGGTNGVDSMNSGIPSNPAGAHDGWIEDAAIFKVNTIYFDLDSSVVKGSEKAKASAVADYLKGHPAQAVRVEGNCDERGTEEYNRSLGDRRAQAIREALVGLGLDSTRVDTISYGKDRPAEQGHDEAAYKKNRRADFVLLSPPK